MRRPLPPPVLDIGCGDGHFASVTYEQKIDVGIDPDHASLIEAKGRGAYRLLVQASGDQLPRPVDFCAVLDCFVLVHSIRTVMLPYLRHYFCDDQERPFCGVARRRDFPPAVG